MDITNTDPGSQFTSAAFTRLLKQHPMFVERLWRTIKYDKVYLNAYERVSHARESLARFIAFYNTGRPHSSLDGQTPDEVYFGHSLDERKAA